MTPRTGVPSGPSNDPDGADEATPTSFEERVIAALHDLDEGEVVSYGEVARRSGAPGAARAVGTILRITGEPVPWWRVVNAAGRLAPGLESDQAQRLRAEGVSVSGGRVARATRDGHPRPG